METIKQGIAGEYFDNLILNTINTIRKNRKRPEHHPYTNIYKKNGCLEMFGFLHFAKMHKKEKNALFLVGPHVARVFQ